MHASEINNLSASNQNMHTEILNNRSLIEQLEKENVTFKETISSLSQSQELLHQKVESFGVRAPVGNFDYKLMSNENKDLESRNSAMFVIQRCINTALTDTINRPG